jgi:hypothetical protein
MLFSRRYILLEEYTFHYQVDLIRRMGPISGLLCHSFSTFSIARRASC